MDLKDKNATQFRTDLENVRDVHAYDQSRQVDGMMMMMMTSSYYKAHSFVS